MLQLNTPLPENCKNCFAYSHSSMECRITGTKILYEAAEVCTSNNCPIEFKSDLSCTNDARNAIKVKDFLKITNYPLVFVCDVTNWEDTTYLILESNEECNYPIHLVSDTLLDCTVTDIAVGKIGDRPVQIVEILDDNI